MTLNVSPQRTPPTATVASSKPSGHSSRSTRAGRSAAPCATSSASTRCTTSGEEIDEFRHDVKLLVSQRRRVARRRRQSHPALAVRRDVRREHVRADGGARRCRCCSRENRKLVYPWIGWQLLVDDYREMSELQRHRPHRGCLARVERVGDAGLRATSTSVPTATPLFFDTQVQKGWETGGPGRLLLIQRRGFDAVRARRVAQHSGFGHRPLLPPQPREESVLRELERARNSSGSTSRTRCCSAATTACAAIRCVTRPASERDPERGAALLHRLVSVASVSRGLRRVRRRRPRGRPRSARGPELSALCTTSARDFG